jgi:PmbA protein
MEKGIAEIVSRIVNALRKTPLDGYELYIEQSSQFQVEAKEGKVETFQASRASGMALRVLKEGRMGFSYATSIPSPDADTGVLSKGLRRMIEDSIGSAEAVSPDSCYDFSPPPATVPSSSPIFDADLEAVAEKAKIQRAILLEETARSIDPKRITKVRKAGYQDGASKRTLINSNGYQFSYEVSLCSASVSAIAEQGGESEVGWEFDYSHFFKDLDIERTGRDAALEALDRLAGRRIPSGIYPVLLKNSLASEFLSLLSHSFLAEQVQKGKSPLEGKKGEIVFSSILSIVDDGLLANGISTAPIDGEGTPSLRTPLVVEGRICGYLYDRYWANRERLNSPAAGAESTGNSRRGGIKGPPGMGISNLFILPGTASFQELLDGLGRGLLVENVMGLHTVDPVSGDFSLGCSGQRIENGKKIHPVKSITIAGNLYELFRKVTGVGRDLRFFGAVGSPSLLIEGLTIGGE